MGISNRDDVIDSRDVIERIEELEGERDDLAQAHRDALSDLREAKDPGDEDLQEDADRAQRDLEAWDADYGDELKALQSLAEEAGGYSPDWRYGATLVRDSHFKDYAMQLADDIGAVPRDLSWPATCIDWDQAARELQQDYTEVDFDGVSYWVR